MLPSQCTARPTNVVYRHCMKLTTLDTPRNLGPILPEMCVHYPRLILLSYDELCLCPSQEG